jgi:hypothetical protein
MRRLLQLLKVAVCGLAFWPSAHAQLIWNGPKITFTKADWADWTLPANQDRITPNVWLARADTQGLFNIKYEDGYTRPTSPADTEWAFMDYNENSKHPEDITAANYASLYFDYWASAINNSPPELVGRPGVVHLISEDIYLDIKFTSWTTGIWVDEVPHGQGGGFSYERTTVPEPSAVLSGAVMGLAGLGLVLYRRRQTGA